MARSTERRALIGQNKLNLATCQSRALMEIIDREKVRSIFDNVRLSLPKDMNNKLHVNGSEKK